MNAVITTTTVEQEISDEALDALADRIVERLSKRVNPQWMRADDATRFFSISRHTLDNWAADGVITTFRHGNVVLFDVASLRPVPTPLTAVARETAA